MSVVQLHVGDITAHSHLSITPMMRKIPNDLRELAQKPSPIRVRRASWRGRAIWIKSAVRSKSTIFHKIQSFFSLLIPIAALQPTVNRGGKQALEQEARRIAELSDAGFRVPEVIAISDEWLVLSDLGITLHALLLGDETPSPTFVLTAVKACSRELGLMHRAGFYHGRAKLNDFVWTPDGQIGFIDFEENVSALSPESIQAREIWLMLTSVSRCSEIAPDAMKFAFDTYKEARGEADYTELRRMLRALKPLCVCVYPWRWLLSNDISRAYKATVFLLKASL